MFSPKYCLVVGLGFMSALANAQSLYLTSATIPPSGWLGKEQVFNGFGCTGGNQSPALQWTAGPAGTKSYALTVYDPDAPTGSGWWHWVIYNIPADVHSLAAGAGDVAGKALPAGAVQGRTDFGTIGYGGACPPQGDKPHRYIFSLYALKQEKLDVPTDATAALVGYMLHANQLAKSSFTAHYGR